ncbi:MAG: biotin carboxyl carrier protein, partial [Alphaproteobacteria bacterium]|nr:biotin carboxyl carrier protein [Alphaproteobacteria bacterium]
MSEIRFVDTTIRDGHQSLWAEAMTTGMMLSVADDLDRAGFDAIELLSGSHVKKAVRELKEDPWERIRLVAKKIKKTPLRVIVGRVKTFEFNPRCMQYLFVKCMADAGIRQARISDEWNNLEGWTNKVGLCREVGLEPILNVIYSVSPKHTDEYFAERTRQAASLGVPRLCLKDPGGLLTPDAVRTLVPIMQENAGGIPIELHTHCTTGLGPINCLEAIKLGITTINTALPPLADGPSLPSLFNVAENARALGHTPLIDEELLRSVSERLTTIAKREGFPIGAPVEYHYSQYLHQVPGGMISNLGHQLKLVGLGDRLDETLAESTRVRADLGYPIMVTPLSQFVGSQAAINVIAGEPYKEVTDQVIKYALGQFGEEAAAARDPDVKAKVLDRPRARELAAWQPEELSLDEMRAKFGGPRTSDEELMLRWLLTTEEIDAMRAAPPPRQYAVARHPLVT